MNPSSPSAPGAVTLVAHDIGPTGGMERQLSALVHGLLSRGWQVTTIARRSQLPPHPLLRQVTVAGPSRPFPLAYPWFMLRGSLAVRRHRQGIVHTMGAIVLNRADLATVHSCHHATRTRRDARRAGGRNPLLRLNAAIAGTMKVLGERLIFGPRRTTHLVSSSAGVADELRRHLGTGEARLTVIPNGVDLDAFAPEPSRRLEQRRRLGLGERDFVALFLGGDWGRKGLRFAVRAVGLVPGCRLLVVGPGETDRYRRLAAESGAEGRVIFAGRTTDLAACYAGADAFVLPTEYDSGPLALYEAAASGLPLLVTRTSGAEGLLEDGRSGWFVERDAEDIARRLRALSEDERIRSEMGRAAREAAAAFSWDEIVDRYVRLYVSLGSPAPALPQSTGLR